MRFTTSAITTFLLALPAVLASPVEPRAKQVEIGHKLGPLPLELRAYNGTHTRSYRALNISTDPNARDSQGLRVLDAFPDGHNSSAQDFYFVTVGSDYKSTSATGEQDGHSRTFYGFLQSAPNPKYGIGAPNVGHGHTHGHFAAVPLSYDDNASLDKQLFSLKVDVLSNQTSTTWHKWILRFLGDKDKEVGYDAALANNAHQTVQWTTAPFSMFGGHVLGFPWDAQYTPPQDL